MNHRSRFLYLLVTISLFGAYGCMRGESAPQIGDPSPRIELYDLNGKRTAIQDDLRDKIVVIRFWRDCCSYDINEMSRVVQIHRKYIEKGLRIVTIHTGGAREDAEGFVSKLKITFPVLLDPDSKVAKRYGVSKLPCTFILDRNGVIRWKIIGPVEGSIRAAYEKFLASLLN